MSIQTTGPLPGVLVRRRGPAPRVVAGLTPEQGDKARLLLEDHAIIPASHPRTFWVVGSRGDLYLTHPHGCTCPAGLHARRCYHSAAAALKLAGDARNTARRHYRQAAKGGPQAASYREFARAARGAA